MCVDCVLKKEYEKTIKNNTFHKRIDFLKSVSPTRPVRQSSVSSEEAFVFHSTSIMLHFTQATMLDEFGNLNVSLFVGFLVRLNF